MRRFPLLVLLALALPACDSGGDDGGDPGQPPPSDVNALTQALGIAGATRIAGPAPTPSASAAAPDIDNGAAELVVGPGGTVTVSFSVDGASSRLARGGSPLAGFFLQLTGADSYIDAPLAQFTDGVGSFQFDLPAGTAEGDFEINYCVYTDDDGDGTADLISNVISTGIQVDGEAGDAGSFGLGSSVVNVQGGGGFSGSAYSYAFGDQLVVIMVDGTLEDYGDESRRAFYFGLQGVDRAGTYAIGGAEGANVALYFDDLDQQNPTYLIASSGSVQVTSFGDRVAGTFDVTGSDFLGGGSRSITGSFEAVRNIGDQPRRPCAARS